MRNAHHTDHQFAITSLNRDESEWNNGVHGADQEKVLAQFCEVIPLHGHTRELVMSGSSAGRGPRRT
jgi:hypothetical protein